MTESHTLKGAALITGAADRLGAVLARGLAEAGYPVVIHYRSSADKAKALAADIKAKGGRAAIASADLAERGERATLIARAAQHFGPLSVLVNNASLFEKDSVATLAEDLWDSHFAVHAEAPAFLARDFAVQVPADRQGLIVNIIDERVLHPSPAAFSYTLSKSVLWTMTQTLAQQLAPRIRVNAIGPGPILPEAGQSQQNYDIRSKSALLGRNADPDDVLEALLYLMDAKSVTGHMIPVDAGEHLTWPERRAPTPRAK